MKFAGDAVLHAPPHQVWEALLDPAVLVRTIPGCERLEETGENAYAMTVTAGVAAVRGTYSGSCALHDLQPPRSLVLRATGAGAPGTIATDVQVGLEDLGDGTTRVTYDADATVGGPVAGVGQRMLGSVSKRMAGEFFRAVDGVLTGAAQPAEPSPVTSAGTAAPATSAPVDGEPRVFASPRLPGGAGTSSPDFVRGLAAGAGLVVLGVVLGAVAARRR